MEIKTDVMSIEKLGNYFFTVPDYQREHVWKAKEHVSKLFEDIENEFSDSKDIYDQSKYFMGSIVIAERSDGDYDVIDGQQRLTTLVLFLIAIREHLVNNHSLNCSEKKLNEIIVKINQILYSYNVATGISKPRISLQYEESKDYIDSLILSKEFIGVYTNSITRMQDAYHLLSTSLNNINEEQLIHFISYLLIKVEMVVIISQNISTALTIFETINQRGFGLNSMDLLKNLLFKVSKNEYFEKVKVIWKHIIKNLEDCNEGEKPLRFLRYFFMARYYNGTLKEDDIFKYIISARGNKELNYNEHTIKFAEELRGKSSLYKDYVNATRSEQVDPKYPWITCIGHIGKRNIRQHIILLLALNDKLKNDKRAIELLCRNIEVLIFYYTITKENTKNLDKKFADFAKELRHIETIENLKNFIKRRFEPEIQENVFEEAFSAVRETDIRPKYRIKYIYGRIENYLREISNLPLYNMNFYNNLQLEHIMPQKPDENKLTSEFENKSTYEYYLRLLGNITLIEPNINQALNKVNNITTSNWFYGKIFEYGKSDIKLTKTISTIEPIGANTL